MESRWDSEKRNNANFTYIRPAHGQTLKSLWRACIAINWDIVHDWWVLEIAEAIVIDVGIIAKRGWAVIENNAVLSSGMCGCGERVFGVLRFACGKD